MKIKTLLLTAIIATATATGSANANILKNIQALVDKCYYCKKNEISDSKDINDKSSLAHCQTCADEKSVKNVENYMLSHAPKATLAPAPAPVAAPAA